MRIVLLVMMFLVPVLNASDRVESSPVGPAQQQARPLPIAIQVVVQQQDAQDKIRASVLAELKKSGANVDVVAEPGQAVSTLWIYGTPTVFNRNPQGYTFAVAHTSSLLVRMASLKMNEVKGVPACAPTASSPLVDGKTTMDQVLGKLALDWQPLKYLNTAALDDLGDSNLESFTHAIVQNFLDRER